MVENQPKIHSGWVTLWILLIAGANVLGILGYVAVAYLLGTNNTAFNTLTKKKRFSSKTLTKIFLSKEPPEASCSCEKIWLA